MKTNRNISPVHIMVLILTSLCLIMCCCGCRTATVKYEELQRIHSKATATKIVVAEQDTTTHTR
jgi:hypothetical protein